MLRTIRNTLATVAALLMLVVAPAAAAPIPFSASYDGSLVATVGPQGPVSAIYGGSGRATQLGAGRMDGNIIVTGPSITCSGGFHAQHTDVLTAANGAKVTLQVDEDACPTG